MNQVIYIEDWLARKEASRKAERLPNYLHEDGTVCYQNKVLNNALRYVRVVVIRVELNHRHIIGRCEKANLLSATHRGRWTISKIKEHIYRIDLQDYCYSYDLYLDSYHPVLHVDPLFWEKYVLPVLKMEQEINALLHISILPIRSSSD